MADIYTKLWAGCLAGTLVQREAKVENPRPPCRKYSRLQAKVTLRTSEDLASL